MTALHVDLTGNIAEAGWNTNAATDLDAVNGPSPVGMTQNNQPHLRRRIGQRTFREWQAADTARRRITRATDHR